MPLFAFILAVSGDIAPESAWKALETVTLSSPPGVNRRAVIEHALATDDSPRIRFNPGMASEIIVSPEGGVVSVAEGLQSSHRMPPNLLSSRWIYSPSVAGRPDQIAMIFGRAFASEPGSISIIDLLPNGKLERVFSDDTFQIDTIETRGGSILLIGKRSLTQMLSACTSTYDPFTVFQLDGSGRFRRSASLSRSYNLSHGYVWAGPKSRDDIHVNVCTKPARLVANRAGKEAPSIDAKPSSPAPTGRLDRWPQDPTPHACNVEFAKTS